MPRFGLIGSGLEGSLSPSHFRRAYGGQWEYDLIDVPTFEQAFDIFLKSYDAVNVTAPFKEDAFRRADVLGESCIGIGAANILVKSPSGIIAQNSDYLALKSLFGKAPSRGLALVVGNGGAGKAAVAAARDCGFEVVCCNRTVREGLRPLSDIAMLAPSASAVIYTLPCPIAEAAAISGVPFLIEASYRQPFLSERCSTYISGRDWNLEQARLGYELMTGHPCCVIP